MKHKNNGKDYPPRCLNAEEISVLLGLSLSATYELMHRSDFPTIYLGRRMVVPIDKYEQWLAQQLSNKNKLEKE